MNDEAHMREQGAVVVSELAARLDRMEDELERLDETVAELVRRVFGGPPRAGFVPKDGPELDRSD